MGYLFASTSLQEFEEHLKQLEQQYHDATHHCYAWRLQPHDVEEFAQDDGEPGGTAGLPILNRLKSHEMVNCGCIVIRYYGGTKLGKSGLIQAYGHTAELCLQEASVATLIPTANFKVQYPYHEQNRIDRLKNSFDLKELDAQYLEKVTLEIACRSEQAPALTKALSKLQHFDIETTHLGDGYIHMRPE